MPQGNLLQLYLEACKEHNVVAQTGVSRKVRRVHQATRDVDSPPFLLPQRRAALLPTAQLLRRARSTQPYPFHRVAAAAAAQDVRQLVHAAVAHVMVGAVPLAGGKPAVRLGTALAAAALLAPS